MNATRRTTEANRVLLICGAIAGPLFVITFLLEQAIHPGYSPLRNSISALALGSQYGWIQPLNFIIAGLLTMAFAVGVRRVAQSGRAAKSGPLLIGLWAFGLIVSGVFITDPDITYPPGTPYAVPVTTHGALHNLGAGIGFTALVVACVAFARRFAALRERGWASYSMLSGVVILAGVILANYGYPEPKA